jgi:hypothetical protein
MPSNNELRPHRLKARLMLERGPYEKRQEKYECSTDAIFIYLAGNTPRDPIPNYTS